jgi:hypothetical protein
MTIPVDAHTGTRMGTEELRGRIDPQPSLILIPSLLEGVRALSTYKFHKLHVEVF